MTDEDLLALANDIGWIGESVNALIEMSGSADNDLAEDFEEFKNSLDPDGDGTITRLELEAYIENPDND